MKKLLLAVLAGLALCVNAGAELKLKNPCADNMVLQQQTEAVVWGFAKPGAVISVSPSWGKTYSAKTDKDGCWIVKVKTPAASFKNYTIKVSGDGGNITIKNVLIGEVWLASGQSNMQMPLSGWPNCPLDNCNAVLAAAPNPDGIRMFNIPLSSGIEPVREAEGKWVLDTPQERAEMSATAYFFAKTVSAALGIPVGIINCAYGGTILECWAPKELCWKWGFPIDDEALNARTVWDRQSGCYNTMLSPCIGYTIKGFIWYQGCSNVTDGKIEHYADRFADMLAYWREYWGIGELPIYTVEIAPYFYGSGLSPQLRAQQWKAAEITPSCGVVPTNDLVYDYEKYNIHPANKQEVGARLAYHALNKDYGLNSIRCEAPKVVRAWKVHPNEIALQLENAQNGFKVSRDIVGLEVAGPDWMFYPVRGFNFDQNAQILYIRSEYVHEPRTVRYCWGDWVIGNLISGDGFPMQTFCVSVEE